MIYCSSGSGSGHYFGKVFVSFPVPVPPDPDSFSTVFQQQTRTGIHHGSGSGCTKAKSAVPAVTVQILAPVP
jgi:hypothetical protein